MNSLSHVLHKVHSRAAQAIRDPVWGHIYLVPELMPLLETAPFAKIRGIKQLGPCHLVYPGASHDRFAHSLGVYWIACRFLEQFERLGNPLELGGANAMAFLGAALCHDLGHFPYTHSLKELPLADHETLSADIILGPELSPILSAQGIDPASVAAIIDHDMPCPDPELLFYRQVLSGVLDPDKLDYLRRDAYCCGVPYGIQDLDYLLSRLRFDSSKHLALAESDVSVIEHILFSKYLMYKAVYWHRDVRISTAMIKKFLFILLTQHSLEPSRLYNLDDSGFAELAQDMALQHELPNLHAMVSRTKLYNLGLEIPYSSLPQIIRQKLCSLEERAKLETALSNELGFGQSAADKNWDVIIDVPEAVSFEVNFPLVGKDGSSRPFLDSSGVFTSRTVSEFTNSLRQIRVLINPDRVFSSSDLTAAAGRILLWSSGAQNHA